jgi:large subunit ribosomal protein L4
VEIAVYNLKGESVRNITISDEVFGVPANEALMHQAMVRQRANARQGTADTKDRGEVHGSNRKLFAQKHTGNARQGSSRSPLRRHGGVVFGPHPRDFRQEMPKQMRRLAIKCALSAKAGANELIVLESLALDVPKTKEMVAILGALKAGKKTLIATRAPEENVIKSARNIPGVKTTPADLLNVIDLLSCEKLLMTEEALRRVEVLWGPKSAGAGV